MEGIVESIAEVCWRTLPLVVDVTPSLDFGNLLVTVVGALAGAGVGAWMAGVISKRNSYREQLLGEIRAINASLALSLEVVNHAGGLKKNHILDLVSTYETQRNQVMSALKAADNVSEKKPLELFMDLRQLPEISPPIRHLQDMVLGRLSVSGKALACVTRLDNAILNVNSALKRRNDLIEIFRDERLPAGATVEDFYLGMRYGRGMVNEEYRDVLSAIKEYTDDVLFFGAELCSDLAKHGDVLVARYRKGRFGGPAPSINRIDFSQTRKQGLMPDPAAYAAWTSGFKEQEPAARRWWWWP